MRFYSHDGVTNYVKYKTGGLQGDPPEFMVFGLVTLHLWGRIFKKFGEVDLRGLDYDDDGNIIGLISKALRLISQLNPGFKLDGNLDFNLGKTMFLDKDTSTRHVYDRTQSFSVERPKPSGHFARFHSEYVLRAGY